MEFKNVNIEKSGASKFQMNRFTKASFEKLNDLLRPGGRWIWRTSEGTYIRAKHGPIGVELDRINQLNEQ